MRIAITHPTRWPLVRRGAERFMEELREYLAARGHVAVAIAHDQTAVHSLASELFRALPIPRRFRNSIGYGFIMPLRSTLRDQRFEIVQSLHYTDGYASVLAAPRAGHKTCFYVTGPPIPAALRRIPPDRWLVRQTIQRADKVLVPSRYVENIVREFYGVEALVLPVPINTERFCPGPESPADPPVVLSVAAFDDLRKGVRPLVRAFRILKERRPRLRLVLSGQMGSELRRELENMLPHGIRQDVDFAGVGRLEDLPLLYRRASVTVLPSKWESYSLVLLESWACGCPVVAAAHGALPELVTDPRIGVLFPPGGNGVEIKDVEALTAAIEAGLELRSWPDTSALCRLKAEQFSWQRLGPAFEALYEGLRLGE